MSSADTLRKSPLAAPARPSASFARTAASAAPRGFRCLRRLGEGAMGIVDLVAPLGGVREVLALKRPREADGACSDGAAAARLRSEAELLHELDHEHIVRARAAGTSTDGRPWLALEPILGLDLLAYAEAHALSLDARLDLFLQLCDAVAYLHARGMLHRDLKPNNVLVAETPRGPSVKLIDFGVAARWEELANERDGELAGTPAFMSPEQIDTSLGSVGPWTDVHGLGVLLYALLTGRPPVAERDALAQGWAGLRQRVCECVPPPPSLACPRNRRLLRGSLDALTLRALAKDPRKRPTDATALASELRIVLACSGAARPLIDFPVRAARALAGTQAVQRVAAALLVVISAVTPLASHSG